MIVQQTMIIYLVDFVLYKQLACSKKAKMRTFILLATLALVAESSGKNKNAQKNVRKQFRKCKKENCADSCDALNHVEECYTCLETQCQIPKRLARVHQCMADSCVDNCVESADSDQCKQCRKDNCVKVARQRTSERKLAGGAPKQRPLAVLDKVSDRIFQQK